MSGIEGFYWDEGFPTSRFQDKRMVNLSRLITSDIQNHSVGVLDALDIVEEARGGRADIEEWSGNATSAFFRPDGVTITDLGPMEEETEYSLDEVHDALIKYWEFLCPASEERRKALEEWAGFYEREHPGARASHPCSGHLPL